MISVMRLLCGATGDYLASEPYCVYEPVARRKELTRVDD